MLIIIYIFPFYIKDVSAVSVNFKIYPEKSEYIIDATQYFELKCEGKKEIAWSTPKSRGVSLHRWLYIKFFLFYYACLQENVINTSTVSPRISISDNTDFPFSSILEIYNASYADTGYYYCYPSGEDIFKSDGMYAQHNTFSMGGVAKIYLYVRGTKKF